MKKFLSSALIGTTILAACGSGDQSATDRFNNAELRANNAMAAMNNATGVRSGGVQLSDRSFVAAQRERSSAASKLPSRVQGSGAVVLQSREQMNIADIAARLSEITEIPHTLAIGPTGIDQPARQTSSDGAEGGLQAQSALTTSATGTSSAQQASIAGSPLARLSMRPNLRGPLSAVLDEIATTFDLEWNYVDGRVIFRDFVTRQYQISALPFTEEVQAEMDSNGIAAASATQTDLWGEIGEAISNMLSEGSNVAFGQSSGTITINARVADHSRVAQYIKSTNERVGQQVAFDINVITVVLNDEDAFGVDLSAAFANSGISLNILGRPPAASGIGVANIGVTSGNVTVQAVANALARYGRVSVETRAGTTTANNRVAPIIVVDNIAYLESTEVIPGLNGGNDRITRNTDTITTGFQMQLMPRILNTRDIMMQYAVRISELNNLATFGEGVDAVQLPEVSTTAFQQQAVVENGQTLVMAGFERKRVEKNEANGGGILRIARSNEAVTQRVATVLMITPTILRR
jgi:type II secretory pathway component GspD/PulD (secretin)